MHSQTIVLIVDNIRSTHNVGSLLRTADGMGIAKVYFCGTTPYPMQESNDPRLPHEALKLQNKIHKTALGAEKSVPWEYCVSTEKILTELGQSGFRIVALEQDERSIPLSSYSCNHEKLALIIGPEVTGISKEIRSLCNDIIEIPMYGTKESFNVAVAAAIALYHLIMVK